jgi:2-hydroxy-3-keto-5-methylthiopentenyl-1-phosphate phosphatase
MKNLSPVSKAAKRDLAPVVFCDFDGTISQLDVTDQILDQLAHPAWREIEREWVMGLIGSRECLERQMALVDAPAKEFHALIDSIPIDPHFSDFCQFTHRRSLPLYIVSDGFDYVIRRIFKRAGVSRQFRNGSHLYASALRVEGHRLFPSFPHSAEGCEHGCATCKPAVMRALSQGRRPVVFVGDGMSDRFALEAADVVFAKRQLLAHCREKEIACHPFDTFQDVQGGLEKWFAPAPARRYRQPVAALS